MHILNFNESIKNVLYIFWKFYDITEYNLLEKQFFECFTHFNR